MVMRRRLSAWRVTDNDSNHTLSLGIRDYVLESDFHLLQILSTRRPRAQRQCQQR
jgi:hypothetical protein